MTTFDTLRLDTLVTSPTNPRKNFNEGRLQELADSIAASGVHQPILVRPLPGSRLQETFAIHGENGLKPRPTHEIVAGERRYRASQLAKVDTIPAMIRELTDDQVLEIQIVENIQRDSLTELETAEGYKTLMEHNNLTAEQVGQKVSKSRSSVYGSLKLLDLHPFAKQSLRDEFITASAALLIARISDIKLQQKAVDFAASVEDDGHSPSIRALQKWLRDNVMLDLSKATFPIESISLTAAGSCKTCKTRTGHDPDLFADVKSDMCTHPPCYHLKAAAHKDALAAQVAAIPKASNRNVDEQQGLGLVSTLAQDARAQLRTAEATQRYIETLQNRASIETHSAQCSACYDTLIDHIYDCPADKTQSLLPVELLRRWLQQYIEMWGDVDLAVALDVPPKGDEKTFADYELECRLRIGRADDADIYRYMAALLLRSDVNNDQTESLLINTFANALEIDLEPVRQEAADQVKAATKAKIAALNKQIKAEKTTSTPPPAGAAIDDAAADAKVKKPTPLRKAKTSAQEAKAGIAAAMQCMEAEPTGALLGGSEVAAVDSGKLAVGAKVKVLDGKHSGKQGTIRAEAKNDMWMVTFGTGAVMFTANLATKSLQVIA